MSFIFKLISFILAVVMSMAGVPVDEAYISSLKEDLFPVAEDVAEDELNEDLLITTEKAPVAFSGQTEKYYSTFDQSKITTDELYVSLADMYSGKTSPDSLAAKNYAHLTGDFVGPYRTVYDSLLSNEWYETNADACESLAWTPSEMQSNPAYYHVLVYTDMIENGIASYYSSSSFLNETFAVTLDMGKQMADTLYVDYYDLVDVVAEDIPDAIYTSLADVYGLDSSAVLSIKASTNLGSSVYEFLRKLSIYVVIDDYFASLADVMTQVRSQSKDANVQNAMNIVVESLKTASSAALEYITTSTDAAETVAFNKAHLSFVACATEEIRSWSETSGKAFGELVTNYLYSSTEKMSRFKTLGIISDFENLVRKVAVANNSSFISATNLKNAQNVIFAEKLTVYTVTYALEALSKFSTVVVSENLQSAIGFTAASFTNYISSAGEIRSLINNTEAYVLESAILFWVDLYWPDYCDLFIPLGEYEPTDYTTIVLNSNGDLTFEYSYTGDGSVSNPYKLYTEYDLELIRSYPASHYQLMNDIEIVATTAWEPISYFSGSFNGNGYTIYSLSINSTSTSRVGFFAQNSGRIRNLTLADASVNSKAEHNGILVGVNYGYIINCSTSGSITISSNASIGGLAGYNSGTIENCSSSATVTGSTTSSSVKAGGLVGYNYANAVTAKIEYSYATGDVSGYMAGGLVGYNRANYNSSAYSRALLNCCYAKGNVYGTVVGGFVGENSVSNTDKSSNQATVTYCYALGDVGSNNTGCGFAGKNNYIIRYCYYNDKNVGNSLAFKATLTKLQLQETYYGWDFENIWAISESENDGYPYLNITGFSTPLNISGWGVANAPYIITNEKQLIALSDGTLSKSAYYRLGNDVTVTANHWTPIAGNLTGTFTGVFDGDNYKISGLKLSDTYFTTVGFIATNSGTIKNLYVESEFTGIDGRTGGLVGENSGTLENCHATTKVSNSSNASNNSDIGGLAGYNTGLVKFCTSSGTVTHNSKGNGNSRGAGGLVGYNYNGTVTLSSSSCDVNSKATDGSFYTGGLVGFNDAYSSTYDYESLSLIEYSYSTGAVNGYIAGGLVGNNYSNGYYATARIINCYSHSDVTGTNVAGLVCRNNIGNADRINKSEILYCYAAGVSGNNNIGPGLVHTNGGTIRYSYYNSSNVGNILGFPVNATRLRQQATYYGWDFENVWYVEEGVELPVLRVTGEEPEVSIIGEGTLGSPYLIETEEQLFAIASEKLPMDAYYTLVNDIEVTALYWTPIGSNGTSVFSGVFDGGNFTISGIKLSDTYYRYVGLFGYSTGTIKNLNVEAKFTNVDGNIGGIVAYSSGLIDNCSAKVEIQKHSSNYHGDYYLGGITGYNSRSIIKNCSSEGSISTASTNQSFLGGIVGYNSNGTISGCSSSATVTASTTQSNHYSGGIAAYSYANEKNAVITECHATGNVSGYYVGGLLGYNKVDSGSALTATVEYCYASGDVDGYYASGLVGYNYSRANTWDQTIANSIIARINNCYALGSVNGTYAAGLVAINDSSGYNSSLSGYATITYCYAAGLVNSGSGAGLVYSGLDDGSNRVVRYSYFSSRNTGNTIGFGVAANRLVKQDTYYGWDFENVWAIDSETNSGYPYLKLSGLTSKTGISGNGSLDNPYIIENEEQLIALVDGELSLGANYVLVSDVDVSAYRWTPIGDNGTANFTGSFNGNGYSIRGVKTPNTTLNYIGVFGKNSGTIKNLNVEVTFTNVSGRVGGLVATNTGTIDNCHAIVNISNNGSSETGGLVGYNNGTIKNSSTSGAVTATSTSHIYVGGLVGQNKHGKISECSSSATVTAPTSNENDTGGLVGYNHVDSGSAAQSVIEYSYATGNVEGYYAGGLVGHNYSRANTWDQTISNSIISRINNCYALGSVNGRYAAGLVAINDSSGYNSSLNGYATITYCYAAGLVNGGSGAGLVYSGLDDGTHRNIRYCYYNSANTGNLLGFPATEDELKTKELFYGYDFDHVWTWDAESNGGYPDILVNGTPDAVEFEGFGDSDTPYLISTEEQLFALVDGKVSLGACYQLTNDIVITAKHWMPIGDNGLAGFSGMFDGNGYTISGVQISDTYLNYIGFFGYNSGTIKNLNIELSFTNVSGRVGGLAATNTGTIDNCSVNASIVNIGSSETGGLVGYNSGTVKNSSSSGTVTAISTSTVSVGGLVGQNCHGKISECSSSAAVTAPTSNENDTGGLVGYNHVDSGSAVQSVIEYSYATGDVAGYNAGGLVGHNYSRANTWDQTISNSIISRINNCYALGSVNGRYAAGLVAINDSSGYNSSLNGYATITYCYAAGLVNGGSGAGLVYSGLDDGTHRHIRYCYYNSANTGNRIGFSALESELKTQELFYGWNFNNEWAISETANGGYPYVKLRGVEQEIEISGYGDEEEPYLIENEQQLWALTSGQIEAGFVSYYKLVNDIYITAKHWTPIGGNGMTAFSGVFDGDGHTIYGVQLLNTGYAYVGLFGKNYGTIKNLNVSGSFSGGTDVGIITGYNGAGGQILKCSSTGEISNASTAGGIAGYNYSGSSTNNITDCYSTASVSATSYAGGIVGHSQSSSSSSGYANITTSYATGSISCSDANYRGGILGRASNRCPVTNCYYNSETSGCTDTAKGAPVTTEQMLLRETYSGFDFDTVWAIDENVNGGYPFLRVPGYSTEANLLSISVGSRPAKTTYYVGDELDTEGLIIKLNYSNGTSETVTEGFEVSYEFNEAGIKPVKVTYEEKSVTFSCTILPIVVESIEVTTLPDKVGYYIDDVFDTAGMVVTAYYNNGAENEVTDYTLAYDFSSSGNKKVTVSYQGVSTEFEVAVYEVKLEKIEITSLPEKTFYYVGDEIDLSGLEVTAYYDNGTSRTVSNYEVDYDFGVSGTAVPVTVLFNGKTAEYTVEVKLVLLESVVITQQPIKTTYFVGETFDISGLEVTANYDNGVSEVLNNYSLSYDFSKAGESTVKITFMTKSVLIPVTVNPLPPTLDDLMITQLPDKLEYYQNEVLDLSGMIITAIYSDGSSEDVTDYTIEGYRPQMLGKQTVVVKYETLSATFEVTVVEPVSVLDEKLIVSSETAKAGENVTVKVNVENNPGMAAFRFYMDYDTSLLSVVSINRGSALPDDSLRHNLTIADGKLIVIWDNPQNSSADGELFEITFTVSEDAPVGEIPLSIYYDAEDVCNEDLENLDFSVIEGGITVYDTVFGDINNDGSINMKDKLLLSKYLAGSIEFSESQLAAADVYKDGEINMRDSLLFNQYLTGYDVTLGQEI